MACGVPDSIEGREQVRGKEKGNSNRDGRPGGSINIGGGGQLNEVRGPCPDDVLGGRTRGGGNVAGGSPDYQREK